MNKMPLLLLTITVMRTSAFVYGAFKNSSQLADENKGPHQAEKASRIESLSLKITVGERETVAPFIDSQTARDFINLLPLALTMDDIGKREKYSGLPQELSKAGTVKTTYQKGDLSYWLGGGLAAFYNQDDHEVKAGLIVLARLEKGIDLFSVPGPVTVKFEAIKK